MEIPLVAMVVIQRFKRDCKSLFCKANPLKTLYMKKVLNQGNRTIRKKTNV